MRYATRVPRSLARSPTGTRSRGHCGLSSSRFPLAGQGGSMYPYLALVPDPGGRECVLAALIHQFGPHASRHVRFCRSWGEFERRILTDGPQLAIFDPYADGPLRTERIARLSTRFPALALLAFAAFPPDRIQEALDLYGLGVHEVMARERGCDAHALAERIASALSRALESKVMPVLVELAPATLLPGMRALLRKARVPIGPREAGALFGAHPATIRKKLRAAGLPSLNKLIIWFRLFHAIHLLADHHRTVENVALALDFPSASALCNQMRRYVGLTPQQVRNAGLHRGLREFARRHAVDGWHPDHPPRPARGLAVRTPARASA
ncbi:MAG TPA: AraC family transcriptional regulator [Longimicrobiales bacterium]